MTASEANLSAIRRPQASFLPDVGAVGVAVACGDGMLFRLSGYRM